MVKLFCKIKDGNKRIIHFAGIKFSYKVKEVPYFNIEVPPLLYPKAVALSEINDEDFQDFNERDLYYYLFENVFYDKDVITKIQENYVEYIPKKSDKNFLDVGCGRGEFLEILNKNGIKAKGIEINSLEYKLLRKKNFDVELCDVVTYLKNTTEVFSGISAIQVVEHLSFDYLYEFIHLAYDNIENGGIIFIETLNSYNLNNLRYFYTDLTHVKPIVPATLQFICEKAGFRNIRIIHSCPDKYGYINYAILGEK